MTPWVELSHLPDSFIEVVKFMIGETLTLEHGYYSIVDTEREQEESLAPDHILERYRFHSAANISSQTPQYHS